MLGKGECMNPYFTKENLLSDILDIGNAENFSLWLVECYFLWQKLTDEQQEKLSDIAPYMTHASVTNAIMSLYDGKYWHPLPDHSLLPEEGMSRDNLIAVSALNMFHDRIIEPTNTSMAKCGFSKFSNFLRAPQPQDLIFFGLSANKWWAEYFKWLLEWNMKSSCWATDKTGDGFLDTDGKLLSFVRLMAIGDQDLYLQCTDLVYDALEDYYYTQGKWKENPTWDGYLDSDGRSSTQFPTGEPERIWRWVFAMYFKEQNNPINRICNELWG